MAEHPDVTLVKNGYDAFNSADIATLTEIIADDAVQHMVGDNLVSGEFKGLDKILGMYGKIAEITNGTYAARSSTPSPTAREPWSSSTARPPSVTAGNSTTFRHSPSRSSTARSST